jgi:hypothetical protein
MKPANSQSSLEDVMYAFAVEPDSGDDTLKRYLRNYPQYAAELITLWHDLSQEICEEDTPLSEEELAWIDAAWQRHATAVPKKTNDLLALLSSAELKGLAKSLEVPLQVITTLRERQVIPNSVPFPFCQRLAKALNSTVEAITNWLALPPVLDPGRSYRADGRPVVQDQISFEQTLINADVPPEKRAFLMAQGD